MEMKMDTLLAVDIGGTKTAVAVVTIEGRILTRLAEPTLQEGPAAGIQQIIALLESVMDKGGINPRQVDGIGVGIPAVLEPGSDFIIWGPNLNGWRNVDLRGALESHFNLPVCIEYDGHTAVLGEWWMGAGKGFQSVMSIIIGTGVGGGMVLDGKLIRGMNRLAGAVGWFILDHACQTDAVRERALGSWESRIAGPGIAAKARKLMEENLSAISPLKSKGDRVSARDVFEAAREGDPLAMKIAGEEAELLGMGIANVVSLVNPEIVILGGSVGSNASFLLPEIKTVMEKYAHPISSQSVLVVTSQLGADAGLFGAAYGILLRLNQDNCSKGGI
jgi:glucokinase